MPPHEANKVVHQLSPSISTEDAAPTIPEDDVVSMSLISEFEPTGNRAWQDTSVSQPETLSHYEKDNQPPKETIQESPIDPAYSPTGRKIRYVTSEPAKLAKHSQRARRPSESFFDNSSSEEEDEDEDEDVANEIPTVEKASCLKISRVSKVDQIPNSPQPEALADENTELTHGCYPNRSGSIQHIDSLVSAKTMKDNVYNHDVVIQAAQSLKGRCSRVNDALSEGRFEASTSLMKPSLQTAFHRSATDEKHAEISPSDLKTAKNGLTRSRSDSALDLGKRKVAIQLEPLNTVYKERRRSTDHCFVTTPFPYSEMSKIKADGEPFPTRFGTSRVENKRETLFINIGLARHPDISISVEISSNENTTFDDETLFNQLRSAYHKRLLGWSRIGFRSVRDISHVALDTPEDNCNDDLPARANSFLKHFRNPSLGRKRKTWIVWLRKQNRRPRRSNPIPGSIRDNVHPRHPASTAGSAKPICHMQLGETDNHDRSSTETVSKSCMKSSFDVFEEESTDFPTVGVELHHSFNFWAIAFLSLCTVWLSISSVILWVLLNVPVTGSEVQRMTGAQTTLDTGTSWRDSPAKVLTGLVLGMMVLIIGILAELCLLAGGWILL